LKAVSWLNDVVGRHHDHGGCGIIATDQERREANAGGGIPLARLTHNSGQGKFRKLAAHRFDKSDVGHDHPLVNGECIAQPVGRLTDHRGLAYQLE